MQCKLDVPEILEDILVRAIELHWPHGTRNGIMQYVRVLPRSRAPRVTRAALDACPAFFPFRAACRGNIPLLSLIRDYNLDLDVDAAALNHLVQNGNEELFAWWRSVGYQDHGKSGFFVTTKVALDLFHPAEAGVAPGDAAIARIADDIKRGALDKVAIEYKRITSDGIAMLDSALAAPDQRVTSVTLHCCDLNVTRVLQLRFPPTVTSLIIYHNRFEHTSREISEDAASMMLPSRLENLNMGLSHMSGELLSILAPQLPTTLKILDLWASRFGDAHAVLHTLKLNSCEVKAVNMAELAQALPQTLRGLSMQQCEFATHGFQQFFTALPPHSLELLDLSYNRNLNVLELDEFGVWTPLDALANWLPSATSLRVLDLSSFSQHGLAFANVASGLPASLEELNLQGTSAEDAVIDALENRDLPLLTKVNIDGTAVTDEGKLRLEALLAQGAAAQQ
ncbi:hypothetical protein H9P43_007718 [Blastocladiella emersonii ATCC 22665]|nr:hypothetical protein H9P43_007718 [Blastocladiella emersonii ATCC 22665]